jgi:hypothetical protein
MTADQLYGWDDQTKQFDIHKPQEKIIQKGYLGSRGKSCADCILAAENIERDADGQPALSKEGKPNACGERGYIGLVVYEVQEVKTVGRKAVTSWTDLRTNGKPFLLYIQLANASALRNPAKKSAVKAVGWRAFARELSTQRLNPFQIITEITLMPSDYSPSPHMHFAAAAAPLTTADLQLKDVAMREHEADLAEADAERAIESRDGLEVAAQGVTTLDDPFSLR